MHFTSTYYILSLTIISIRMLQYFECVFFCLVIFNAAFVTLDPSVHSGLMLSMIDVLVFLSIHDTLSTLLQHHNSKASFSHVFSLPQVSAPYSTIGNTRTFTSFTFVSSVTPLSFHSDVSPPIAVFLIVMCVKVQILPADSPLNRWQTYYF